MVFSNEKSRRDDRNDIDHQVRGTLSIRGAYLRDTQEVGAFVGENISIQNGTVKFERVLTKKPLSFWKNTTIEMTVVNQQIHVKSKNVDGMWTYVYSRITNASSAAKPQSAPLASPQPPSVGSSVPKRPIPTPASPSASAPVIGKSPPATTPPTNNVWLTSLDLAKQKAADKKLDVLVAFLSDSKKSTAMQKTLLSSPRFFEQAQRKFVLVMVSLPSGRSTKSLDSMLQSVALLKQYGITQIPAVVMLDAQGLPFAGHGYLDISLDEYLQRLEIMAGNRVRRDELFAKAAQTQEPEQQLALAEQTLALFETTASSIPDKDSEDEGAGFLRNIIPTSLAGSYPTHLQNWIRIARQCDPNNERGKLEIFFEADWRAKLQQTTDKKERETIARRVDAWNKQYKFLDQDRGARVHLMAGFAMSTADKDAEAARFFEAATKYSPKNPLLAIFVRVLGKSLEGAGQVSSGTGFIIHSNGYLLTNHHVIEGPGKLVVRRPDKDEEIPAEVVAKDPEQDIALIRVDPKKFTTFKPLFVSNAPVGRGSRVAMFGYPLGDSIGKGLKFSQGSVSGLPDQSNDFMLLIDGRVNPGNSGGPLCSPRGHVVGMVTAKFAAREGLDSYGAAIPASKLHEFLKKNFPTYKIPAATSSGANLEWDAVDRQVNQSVLMVLKVQK